MSKEIILTKEQCSRIRTSKDLDDIYAYFERDYEQGENESDEAFLDRLPTYLFDTTKEEQERLFKLTSLMCYQLGNFDLDNVNRILGNKTLTITLSYTEINDLIDLENRLSAPEFRQYEEDKFLISDILDKIMGEKEND